MRTVINNNISQKLKDRVRAFVKDGSSFSELSDWSYRYYAFKLKDTGWEGEFLKNESILKMVRDLYDAIYDLKEDSFTILAKE